MRKCIGFLFYVLTLSGGWYYRSDYFPIISDVFRKENKLYFLINKKDTNIIIEKVKNYFFEYYFESEDTLYLDKAVIERIKDIKSKRPLYKYEEFIEFKISNKSKIIVKKAENEFERNWVAIFYRDKSDTFYLPKLTFTTFKRLKTDFNNYVKRVSGSYEDFKKSRVFTYSIEDCYLIKDKLWFTIEFYSGEGLEGIGGIGYFDLKKKKFGIARLPELIDYSVVASLNIGNSIFISSAYKTEGSSLYNNCIIEFNTENCNYRIYNFENTVFRNFGVKKITKIGKDTLVFYTGNEAVLYDINNNYWERFTIFLRTKEDSTPLFYRKIVNPKQPKRKIEDSIIKYVNKGKEFYSLHFSWLGAIEIETKFSICGETHDEWKIPELKNIDKTPIWNSHESPLLLSKDNQTFVFYASPIKESKKISKGLYYVCVYGAYIERNKVEIILKKTKEGYFEKPEWKKFSENPFVQMEEEVEKMRKER